MNQPVQAIAEQVRVIRRGLEQRLDLRLLEKRPVTAWLVERAADLLSKYQVGDDGKTGYERWKGKPFHGEEIEFGEKILYRENMKASAKQNKLDFRRVEVTTWVVGGEAIVGTRAGIVRARTVRRVGAHRWWDRDLAQGASPRDNRPARKRSSSHAQQHTTPRAYSAPEASLAHDTRRHVNGWMNEYIAPHAKAQRSVASRVSTAHARRVRVRVCLHPTHVSARAQTHSSAHTPRRARTKRTFPSRSRRVQVHHVGLPCVVLVLHRFRPAVSAAVWEFQRFAAFVCWLEKDGYFSTDLMGTRPDRYIGVPESGRSRDGPLQIS